MSESSPESTIAERVLCERTTAFVGWVRGALETPEKRKPVFRVRTSARRLEAALSALRPMLRRSSRRSLKDAVRSIRREAGFVRDCDVIAKRLGATIPMQQDPARTGAIGYLVGHLGARRDVASSALLCTMERRIEALGEHELAATDMVKSDSAVAKSHTIDAVAGEALRDSALAFAATSEHDLTQLHLLHELRKAGKRLRYTVEVFRPMLPEPLATEVMTRLRDCQQRLGHINDLHVKTLMIESVRERKDAKPVLVGLARLHTDMSASLERDHAAFVRWWWDVGAAQQLLGCAHELAVVRSEARVA